jgi:hypothetical protein
MIAKGSVILHRDQRRSTRDLRRFDIFYRIIDWSVIGDGVNRFSPRV